MSASFDWSVFAHYAWPPTGLSNPLIVTGLVTTIYVAVTAQLLACLIGTVAALLQQSRSRIANLLVGAYVLYFRGTPLLVQVVIIYFGASRLGIYKFPDIYFAGYLVPGAAQAGILALGLNKGAYMTEIVRAGLLSVDSGQTEAARALGMTRGRVMRHIVFPQAARVIVPPLGNEFNGTMKDTALLTIIGGVELFHAFSQLNGLLFRPFELFLAMSLYYLLLTLIWSGVQALIERRLNRGVSRTDVRRVRRRREIGVLTPRSNP